MIVLQIMASLFIGVTCLLCVSLASDRTADFTLKVLDPWWGRWWHDAIYWTVSAVVVTLSLTVAIVVSVGSVAKIFGLW